MSTNITMTDLPSKQVVKDFNCKLKVISMTRDSRLEDKEPRVEMDFETEAGDKISMEFQEEGIRKLYKCLEEAQSKLDEVQSKSSKKTHS